MDYSMLLSPMKIGNLENPFAEGTVEKAVSAVARELDRLDARLNG